MRPIEFPESNSTLGKPENMTDEQCGPLPVHRHVTADNFPALISCWKLSPEELEEVNRTGVVYVNTLGQTLAPFSVMGHNPFIKEEACQG